MTSHSLADTSYLGKTALVNTLVNALQVVPRTLWGRYRGLVWDHQRSERQARLGVSAKKADVSFLGMADPDLLQTSPETPTSIQCSVDDLMI